MFGKQNPRLRQRQMRLGRTLGAATSTSGRLLYKNGSTDKPRALLWPVRFRDALTTAVIRRESPA